MADTKDICPIHEDGVHKHYLFKTFDTYEPIDAQAIREINAQTIFSSSEITIFPQVYEHVEYGVLSCKCGDVIKKRIRQA